MFIFNYIFTDRNTNIVKYKRGQRFTGGSLFLDVFFPHGPGIKQEKSKENFPGPVGNASRNSGTLLDVSICLSVSCTVLLSTVQDLVVTVLLSPSQVLSRIIVGNFHSGDLDSVSCQHSSSPGFLLLAFLTGSV